MEKSIDELIEDLNDDDEFVVEEAKGLLEMRCEESTDPLINALKHKNKNIRLNSANVLGNINDTKTIDHLIKLLYDNNKLVRREASTVLSRMGEPAVDPLIKVLNDPNWRVRGAAAWALGNIKNEKAIPFLEKLLDDESGFVKSGAKNAIASIQGKT
ncbi:MAG: HEAT repeat domain-containing protein [Methanobacteriaceae archaeon]|jgi:HEAT repeat protein|nr:HEAT repeat domain-containing protein [Methanobacteriaceae archaeon]